MEVFGVKRVGTYSLRRVITRFLTVELAAKIHKVPLDQMLSHLEKATQSASRSIQDAVTRCGVEKYRAGPPPRCIP